MNIIHDFYVNKNYSCLKFFILVDYILFLKNSLFVYHFSAANFMDEPAFFFMGCSLAVVENNLWSFTGDIEGKENIVVVDIFDIAVDAVGNSNCYRAFDD